MLKTLTYLISNHLGLLAKDIKHTALQCLFILGESVLLPGVVKDASIKVVSCHAALKEAQTSPVVWLLFEPK